MKKDITPSECAGWIYCRVQYSFNRTVAGSQPLPSSLLIPLFSDAASEDAHQTEWMKPFGVGVLIVLFGEQMMATSLPPELYCQHLKQVRVFRSLSGWNTIPIVENIGLNFRLLKGAVSWVDLPHVGFNDRTHFLHESHGFLGIKSCGV